MAVVCSVCSARPGSPGCSACSARRLAAALSAPGVARCSLCGARRAAPGSPWCTRCRPSARRLLAAAVAAGRPVQRLLFACMFLCLWVS